MFTSIVQGNWYRVSFRSPFWRPTGCYQDLHNEFNWFDSQPTTVVEGRKSHQIFSRNSWSDTEAAEEGDVTSEMFIHFLNFLIHFHLRWIILWPWDVPNALRVHKFSFPFHILYKILRNTKNLRSWGSVLGRMYMAWTVVYPCQGILTTKQNNIAYTSWSHDEFSPTSAMVNGKKDIFQLWRLWKNHGVFVWKCMLAS